MTASVDQLYAGTEYNIPIDMARDLISREKAIEIGVESVTPPTFEAPTLVPFETKPIEPQEKPRKKVKRA